MYFVSGTTGVVIPYGGDRSEASLVEFVNGEAARWRGAQASSQQAGEGAAPMERDEL